MAGRSVFPVAQGFPNSSTCSRVVLLGSNDVSFFVRPIVAPLQATDIRPGNSYRRQLGSCLAATATVLDSRSDLGYPARRVFRHGRWVGKEAVGRRPSRLGPPILPGYLSRASRAGSPTRSKRPRQCDGDPIFAENIGDLILVSWPSRACPRRRLRYDKRSGLHSSDHMTRAP
jgi:hypothetical protein